VVIKLIRFKYVFFFLSFFFLAGDCEPVYERVDSDPELESQPTDLTPGIQNVGQPVIS